jgi:hypothetical protein
MNTFSSTAVGIGLQILKWIGELRKLVDALAERAEKLLTAEEGAEIHYRDWKREPRD